MGSSVISALSLSRKLCRTTKALLSRWSRRFPLRIDVAGAGTELAGKGFFRGHHVSTSVGPSFAIPARERIPAISATNSARSSP